MAEAFIRLGAFGFKSRSLRVGPLPRTVGVAANALARLPVQTTDYMSGYRQIEVEGYLKGRDTVGETAAEHLARLWSNLEAECRKDANTLTVRGDWPLAAARVYHVVKNEGLPTFDLPLEARRLAYVTFRLSLSCRD